METDAASEVKRECPSIMFLAQSWNRSIKAICGVERPLIAREFGQLKMLRHRLGEVTVEVISWTLDHWHSFSLLTRDEAGLPCAPPTPHIGFLLAHHDVARQMWVQSIAEEEALKRQKELQAQPITPPEGYYFWHGNLVPIPESPEAKAARQAEQLAMYSAFLAELEEQRTKADQDG
jgi:hypothetical protein